MKRTPLLVAAAVMVVVAVGIGIEVPTVASAAAISQEICDPNADFFLGEEDYPEAARLHRELLVKRPDDALVHYHLGYAYGMLGDRAGELREYREALALGLTNWDLFLNLGLAELDHGDLNAARDALQMAVLAGPGHPEAHFNLGLVYERQGMLARAQQQILASLVLDPSQLDARNMLAVIAARRGDYADAAAQWRALIHDAPDYQPAHANLALLEKNSAPIAIVTPQAQRNVAFVFTTHPPR
ncbi:MAG TPA: tetratricopeptide repeat protein [Candidatus Binataceae bacterium]|nr:tetratricopeptide repeat protein [Candidatus Binataceae bacterium]